MKKIFFALITVLTAQMLQAQERVAGEFLMKMNSNTSKEERVEMIKAVRDAGGFVAKKYLLVNGLLHIKTDKQISDEEFLTNLNKAREDKRLSIEYVTPNFLRKVTVLGSDKNALSKPLQTDPAMPDPVTPPQGPFKFDKGGWGNYGISHARLKDVYEKMNFRGSRKTVIAVIDTGVDYTHPDLIANMWRNPGEIPANGIDDDHNGYIDDVVGYDFANHDAFPFDDHYHGTHVSGIAAATGGNGIGGLGNCPDCSIMGLKFITSQGSGTDADAISAIEYAVKMKADVINCSWGGEGDSPALEQAFKAASQAGTFIVVAAGNAGKDITSSKFFPARYQNKGMYTVSAIYFDRYRPQWSNYSRVYSHVVYAGVDVTSTVPGPSYDRLSGTSMASPGVAGLLGLIKSYKPNITQDEMEELIKRNIIAAGNGGTKYLGFPNGWNIFQILKNSN